MRAETRRQSVSSFDLGWEYMYQETDIFIFFAAMHMSKCVLILRLQVNISKQVSFQIQNPLIMRIDCTLMAIMVDQALLQIRHYVLKSRDIILSTKVCIVKAMVFPVVMYRCESWTIKKAECQRIDAFNLMLEKTVERLLDCKKI